MVNLFAAPKEGKSILSMQMALAIANPAIPDWMGYEVQQHGPVLYFQIDTPRNLWLSRIDGQHRAGIHFPEDLWFLDRDDCPDYAFDIFNPEHAQWLRDQADEIPYKLIIIDVLREIHEADEDNSTAMKRVFTALKKATLPAALLLVSHSRKPSREATPGLMNNNRGSGYIAGKVDTIMELRSKKLMMKGRSLGHTTMHLKQDPASFFWFPELDPQEVAADLIAAFPHTSTRELASKLHEKLAGGKSLEACRGILRRLSPEKGDVA
jgi:RecA-family ATPase